MALKLNYNCNSSPSLYVAGERSEASWCLWRTHFIHLYTICTYPSSPASSSHHSPTNLLKHRPASLCCTLPHFSLPLDSFRSLYITHKPSVIQSSSPQHQHKKGEKEGAAVVPSFSPFFYSTHPTFSPNPCLPPFSTSLLPTPASLLH